MSDFSEYDSVFIAALVGKDEKEKGKIIDHVVANTKKHTHIIMRSVNNLGSLLYPQITLSHLKNIQVIHTSQSPKDIINNIIIGKKK